MPDDLDRGVERALNEGRLRREALEEEMAGVDRRAASHPGSRISGSKNRRAEVARTLQERFGLRSLEAAGVARPRDLQELVACVREALVSKRSIRMVGAVRSHSVASTPGSSLVVSSDRLKRVFGGVGRDLLGLKLRPNAVSDRLARVQAGVPVRKLLWELKREGRALTNHGSGDFQSLVGAIATGTHGSAHWCPSLAGLVRALVVVRVEQTSSGPRPRVELIQRAEDATVQAPVYARPSGGHWRSKNGVIVHPVFDDSAFAAHIVGLGCLGLVYSVTIDTIPMIRVREWREPALLNTVLSELPSLLDDHRHVEVVVDPYPRKDTGGVAKRSEVVSSFDPDALRCQVVRRRATDDPVAGMRPPAMDFGALPVASAVIGSRIRDLLDDPVTVAPKGAHSMLSCGSVTGPRGIVDALPELLLLNFKYRGLGAEWAVPNEKLESAIRSVVEEGWTHFEAFRRASGWRGSSHDAVAKRVRLLEQHVPFFNGPSIRWVKGEPALLAGTHHADRIHRPVALWACIEVGFLGAPKLEKILTKRKRHFGFGPEDPVPDSLTGRLCDRLRKRDAVRRQDPTLVRPVNLPEIKRPEMRRMIRLYAAYERGRLACLKGLQERMLGVGGRPHQGLWHDLSWEGVERCWGDAAREWRRRFEAVNPVGTFNGALTEQWRIGSPQPS